MANAIYNSFKQKIMNGSIDLDTDTIKVMLVTSSYTPNIDTHVFQSDVTNEVVGTNYTTGGNTLTGLTVTQDNTNDRGVFDANDLTFTNVTLTARGAVIYKNTGTPATSPLIGYIDFNSNKTFTAEDMKIEWATTGILYAS